MPFWPFYMLAFGALIAWGVRHSLGAAIAPGLILLGLVGMRGVVNMHPDLQELGSCALWLCIGAALFYFKSYAPAFFCGLSALVYALLLPLGFGIERLGVMPILADLCLLGAFLSIVGGFGALGRSSGDVGSGSDLSRVALYTLGVAAR